MFLVAAFFMKVQEVFTAADPPTKEESVEENGQLVVDEVVKTNHNGVTSTELPIPHTNDPDIQCSSMNGNLPSVKTASSSSSESESDYESISRDESNSDTESISSADSNHSQPGETSDLELPVCTAEVNDQNINLIMNVEHETEPICCSSGQTNPNSVREGCTVCDSDILQNEAPNCSDKEGWFHSLNQEQIKSTLETKSLPAHSVENETLLENLVLSIEDEIQCCCSQSGTNIASDQLDINDNIETVVTHAAGYVYENNDVIHVIENSTNQMSSFETSGVAQNETLRHLAENLRDYEEGILQSKIFSQLKKKRVTFKPVESSEEEEDLILQNNIGIYNDGLNEFFIFEDRTNTDSFILQQNLKCYLNGLEKLNKQTLLLDYSNPNAEAIDISSENGYSTANKSTPETVRKESHLEDDKANIDSLILQQNLKCYLNGLEKHENQSLLLDYSIPNTEVIYASSEDGHPTANLAASETVSKECILEESMSSIIDGCEPNIAPDHTSITDLKSNVKSFEDELEKHMTNDSFVPETHIIVPDNNTSQTILQKNIDDYYSEIDICLKKHETTNSTICETKSRDFASERIKFALKTVDEVVAEAKIICDRIFLKQSLDAANNRESEVEELSFKTDLSIPIESGWDAEHIGESLGDAELNNDPLVTNDTVNDLRFPQVKRNEHFRKDHHNHSLSSQGIHDSTRKVKIGGSSANNKPAEDMEDDDIFKVLEMTDEIDYNEDLCSPKTSPKLMRLIQTLASGGYYDDDSDLSDEDEKSKKEEKSLSLSTTPICHTSENKDNVPLGKVNTIEKQVSTTMSPSLKTDFKPTNDTPATNLQQNLQEYNHHISASLEGKPGAKETDTDKHRAMTTLSETEHKYIASKTADEVVAEAKKICDRMLEEHDKEMAIANQSRINKRESNVANEDDDIFRVLEMTDYENSFDEDLCSPKSSPKLLRLIQSLALGSNFGDDLDISDEDDDANSCKDEKCNDTSLDSQNDHDQKIEEIKKGECLNSTNKIDLKNSPNVEMNLPQYNTYPNPPPRKKKSMSVSCLQSDIVKEERSVLTTNSINITNQIFQNNRVIVPPPRKKRKKNKPLASSYSMSDVSIIEFDSEFLNGVKNADNIKSLVTDSNEENCLLYSKKDSKHELHFAAPEVSASLVEYNVFDARKQSQRASIALIDDDDRDDKPDISFEARKTPYVKKKSYTFTSSDIYAKEARANVNLKRSKSSVSKLIKKTFTFKKANKNEDPPCMPNLVKRYMKVRKNKKKKKSKGMASIPEEQVLPSLTKTESFASIFMGSSSENLEWDNLETYVSNNFLSFPEDSSPSMQRSASNVELLRQLKPNQGSIKKNGMKRSSSFIQLTANPKSFVKRLVTEDSTVSLNPEAIKRAHELLNKSIELGTTEGKIKPSSLIGQASKSVREYEFGRNSLDDAEIQKSLAVGTSKSEFKSTNTPAIMSNKFIKSSFASLSRLSSPTTISNSSQSLRSTNKDMEYDEKLFTAPLSLLKVKKNNTAVPTRAEQAETLNVIHERIQSGKVITHSFKVSPDRSIIPVQRPIPDNTATESSVVYSFPYTSERRMDKDIETIENKMIMDMAYDQETLNNVDNTNEVGKTHYSVNSTQNYDKIPDKISNKYYLTGQIDDQLPSNGAIKFNQDSDDHEDNCTISPIEVLKDINNKIQSIHNRMQRNSEELILSAQKREALLAMQSGIESSNAEDIEISITESEDCSSESQTKNEGLEECPTVEADSDDHKSDQVSNITTSFANEIDQMAGESEPSMFINQNLSDSAILTTTKQEKILNEPISENAISQNDNDISGYPEENINSMPSLESKSVTYSAESENAITSVLSDEQNLTTGYKSHISAFYMSVNNNSVELPRTDSNGTDLEKTAKLGNDDSTVEFSDDQNDIEKVSILEDALIAADSNAETNDNRVLFSSESGSIVDSKSSMAQTIETELDTNGSPVMTGGYDYHDDEKPTNDIQRSQSLPSTKAYIDIHSRKTVRVSSPFAEKKFLVTWPVDITEDVKRFEIAKEYQFDYEYINADQTDSISMDGVVMAGSHSANDHACLPLTKSLPEIILRTWSERQDSIDADMNKRSERQSDIPAAAVLQIASQTSEAIIVKKEEERIQKDRCVEIYPETVRQRQRNMAPSPNKVDIKNWEITDDTDVVKDKKLLPSVKALRSQFENGGKDGSNSPTGNSLAGRSSSSSSTSSLGMPSVDVSSSHASLTSAQPENVEPTEPDGPIDPIYRQFKNSTQDFRDLVSKPPSTIGWNPQPLLKKLYHLPQAPQVSSRESAFIDIAGYLDKLPCGRKKSTFWNAWKRRYFCAKKGVLYCYHNNQMDKLSMKLPLLGGKVEIMDPSVISVEDGKNDASSSGMLGIDDGKGHYVVVRCVSRPEAERWKAALDSHVIDDFASQYVQPWPKTTNPAMLRDTIVIDIGSCSVRAGVLTSQATLPQIFFPSVVATNRDTQRQIWGAEALSPEVRSSSNVSFPIKPSHKISKFSVDLNAVSSLLQKTFADLNVDPKHYNVQLSVPRVLNPTTQTELMKILFDKFGVRGVNLTHQSILALYAYNATSGIVVDIGERIDVVPIIDGYIVDGGVSRVPYGGYRILEHLRHYLFQKNVSLLNETESYIIRAVLEMICYCAQHYNTEKARCAKAPDNFEKHAPLSDFFPNTSQFEAFHDISMNFGRFQATEGLFNPEAWGLDHPGIHKLVHKAIQECSMDIRKEMSKSIFLAGGVSQLPGLSDRLRTELDNLTPPAVRPKVHCSPYRYHASYLGACVLAESEAFSQSKISRDEWQKHGNSSLRKWAL